MSGKGNLHQLLDESIHGNSKSQYALYKHLYPNLYRVACRYGFRKHEISEVINDAFLKILSVKIKAIEIENIEAWSVKVAVNTAIDKFRKLTADFRKVDEVDIAHAELGMSRKTDQPDSMDGHKYLLYLLDQLKVMERLVFNLHVIEGYDHNEIADKLKTSNNMSRKYLSQARKRLQEMHLTINAEYEG